MARLKPGQVAKLEREAAQQIALMPCGRGGCKNPARTKFADRWVCFACRDDLHAEESKKACEAKGLRTVDEMRDYCKRMARTFGRPSFDTWAKNMRQETVDLIERIDGQDSKSLERLRAAGVIDGRNKLIPLDARVTAAKAYRAERARLIVEQRESSAGQGVAPDPAPTLPAAS